MALYFCTSTAYLLFKEPPHHSEGGEPLYLFSANQEASAEIYNNLYQIVQRMQPACLNEEECDENLPIKTCEDNFIIIEESEEIEIKQENNCVFIRGPQDSLIKITDEFLFKVLGIRQ